MIQDQLKESKVAITSRAYIAISDLSVWRSRTQKYDHPEHC